MKDKKKAKVEKAQEVRREAIASVETSKSKAAPKAKEKPVAKSTKTSPATIGYANAVTNACDAGDVQKMHLPGGRATNTPATGAARGNPKVPAVRDQPPVSHSSDAGVDAGDRLSRGEGLPTPNVVTTGTFNRAHRRSTGVPDVGTRTGTSTPLPTATSTEGIALYITGRQVCRLMQTMTYQLGELSKELGDEEGNNASKEIERIVGLLSARYNAGIPKEEPVQKKLAR